MTDIVKRLRSAAPEHMLVERDLIEAADEIERLQTENYQVRTALMKASKDIVQLRKALAEQRGEQDV